MDRFKENYYVLMTINSKEKNEKKSFAHQQKQEAHLVENCRKPYKKIQRIQ